MPRLKTLWCRTLDSKYSNYPTPVPTFYSEFKVTLTDSLRVSGLANQMSIFTRVTNERAGAVKMVTDHGVIISYQFTLALGPTHSSPTRVAPSAPGPLMEPLNSTAVMTNLSNILIKLLKKC